MEPWKIQILEINNQNLNPQIYDCSLLEKHYLSKMFNQISNNLYKEATYNILSNSIMDLEDKETSISSLLSPKCIRRIPAAKTIWKSFQGAPNKNPSLVSWSMPLSHQEAVEPAMKFNYSTIQGVDHITKTKRTTNKKLTQLSDKRKKWQLRSPGQVIVRGTMD